MDTVQWAEMLKSLVEAENARLTMRRAEGRRELAARLGSRPVTGLVGASTLRLTRLSLALPCYAPRPAPGREDQAPELVRLDRPGFWRRLFQRWRPLTLLFEVFDEGSGALARVSLQSQAGGNKASAPGDLPPEAGASPSSITKLPGAPEEQEYP